MSNLSKDDKDEIQLPGFRFHPTDEELVGFYLRRKVDKKPINMELIKQIDIYKHDPWDLAKPTNVGENEWYFYCKRGRKYRNSVRPNRVTGSGFWKATGIDKSIYSVKPKQCHECIGLKKTLVYYLGSAGKGTKTDWMMHEFRLPALSNNSNISNIDKNSMPQEAEVWTLCRIFKRNVSSRKYIPNYRETSNKHHQSGSSRSCSLAESENQQTYINFTSSMIDEKKMDVSPKIERHQQYVGQLPFIAQPSPMTSPMSFSNNFEVNEFFTYENWDELRSVVEFVLDPSTAL